MSKKTKSKPNKPPQNHKPKSDRSYLHAMEESNLGMNTTIQILYTPLETSFISSKSQGGVRKHYSVLTQVKSM